MCKQLKINSLRFVEQYVDLDRPVLLAFSGGVDSTALFLLLKEVPGLSLSLAYVDHGWREEGLLEVEKVKAIGDQHGMRTHFTDLRSLGLRGNLENQCRHARYAFFQQLCDRYGYQGVFLGHHADDQAETVLKRVLECAPMSKFSAMKMVSTKEEGLRCFRPLLNVRKSDLLAFVRQQGCDFFDDYTNCDTRFLRARMREEIFPFIEERFHKNAASNLCLLATEAEKMEQYLEERTAGISVPIIDGPLIKAIDFSSVLNVHPFEFEFFCRKLLRMHSFRLSRKQLDLLCSLLLSKAANKKVEQGRHLFEVDRGRLFICDRNLEKDQQRRALINHASLGSWTVAIDEYSSVMQSSWQSATAGKLSISLSSEKSYEIGFADPGERFAHLGVLRDWWAKYRVPRFLWRHVPVIYSDSTVVHEFLSGRAPFLNNFSSHSVSCRLQLDSE